MLSRFESVADALQLLRLMAMARWARQQMRKLTRGLRLVPIGNLTPSLVRRRRTIPLRFFAEALGALSWSLWLFGRTLLSPRFPKQAFVAVWDTIEPARSERWPNSEDGQGAHSGPAPGDRLKVGLAPGESFTHIRRVLKKRSSRGVVRIGLVQEIAGQGRYSENALCVWVRPSGVEVDHLEHELPYSVVRWDVVEPETLDGVTHEIRPWREVQSDVVLLFATTPDPDWLTESKCDSLLWAPHRYFYAFGSRLATGLASGLLRIVQLSLLAYAYFQAVNAIPTSPFELWVLQYSLRMLAVFWLARLLWKHMSRRFRIEPPSVRRPAGLVGIFTNYVDEWTLWHGSSRRALSIGDRERNRCWWQALRSDYEHSVIRELNHIRSFLRHLRHSAN